jgi:DinB family protein
MNWTKLLLAEVEMAFTATMGLLELVDDDKLDWKPATGDNWMTTGQLLYHLQGSCGLCCKGFVTGDWGMPEGAEGSEMSEDEMLPPAEKLPSLDSVAQAKEKLAADKALAIEMINQAGEDDLANKTTSAPWTPDFQTNLGHHLLMMVGHLNSHKSQLFYYLKLQGKPVHTGTLWGM